MCTIKKDLSLNSTLELFGSNKEKLRLFERKNKKLKNKFKM